MATLDLNELLNRSIANVKGGSQTIQTNESNLNLDLENTQTDIQKSNLNLALNLEAVEERQSLNLDEKVLNNLKAALAAGVATSAVLEARQLARV